MKILFITGSLNQGGAEYQILELARLFRDQGHKVEVFAITDYDFFKPYIEKHELVYSHLFNHQSKLKRVYLTSRKIKRIKPDLVLSYLKVTSQVALLGKLLSGVKTKLIVGERTSDLQKFKDFYHFNFMRLADFITVNSISKLSYLQSRFPGILHKLDFFPNIIDLNKFYFLQKSFQEDPLKIGFVGRLSPEKNILNLIDAVKILLQKNCNLTLQLFGDSKNTAFLKEVEDKIKQEGLENVVVYQGKLTNVLEAYQAIDLLCLISDYEGFSNVISEALCCGIPVVTSDIPENKYLIEDGVNGFVVNHKNPLGIAQGIEKYINLSIASKKQMSLENRMKAERIFDKKKLYSDYIKLIESL